MDESLRAAVVARWTDRAAAERASQKTMRQLAEDVRCLLGDHPVVSQLERASADEARHAILCDAVLAQVHTPPATPSSTPGLPSTTASTPAGVLAEQVVFLLCAGEAIATDVLRATAAAASAPGIANTLQGIARDEARHAALGWTVLDALLDALDAPTRDTLAQQAPRQATRAVLAYEASSPIEVSPALAAWGVLDRARVSHLAKRALATRIATKLHTRGLWPTR